MYALHATLMWCRLDRHVGLLAAALTLDTTGISSDTSTEMSPMTISNSVRLKPRRAARRSARRRCDCVTGCCMTRSCREVPAHVRSDKEDVFDAPGAVARVGVGDIDAGAADDPVAVQVGGIKDVVAGVADEQVGAGVAVDLVVEVRPEDGVGALPAVGEDAVRAAGGINQVRSLPAVDDGVDALPAQVDLVVVLL